MADRIARNGTHGKILEAHRWIGCARGARGGHERGAARCSEAGIATMRERKISARALA